MVLVDMDQPKSQILTRPYFSLIIYPLINDVLRFQVTMYDFVLVHVIQRPTDLTNDVPSHIFRNSSSFFEKLVKLP
jgi:hypothetical protein